MVAMTAQDARVGVVIVSLPNERLDLCEPLQDGLRCALSEAGFEVVCASETALSEEGLVAAIRQFLNRPRFSGDSFV